MYKYNVWLKKVLLTHGLSTILEPQYQGAIYPLAFLT
jgi:hypothetical protein